MEELTELGRETLVEHVHDASVARIASLVSRQKGTPKKGTVAKLGKIPRINPRPEPGWMLATRRRWQLHQLQALPERELLWLVRALMRQTAPVTAEEYRSQLVVCPEYAADARCRRSDFHSSGGRCQRDDCDEFHVCGFYLADLCRRPDSTCPLGH
ncbi:hypothetical protein FJT64_013726 [Amphibalanus amphitrite]|uniref:Uncharacterized protein n=1 Tax=Amphibalanus amphitrite TaxID=1232801 RepID=A0A6A4VE81_AMPAM|nr:hypothetical protein FJT64_013726 [Amphibalanus amphitrite]